MTMIEQDPELTARQTEASSLNAFFVQAWINDPAKDTLALRFLRFRPKAELRLLAAAATTEGLPAVADLVDECLRIHGQGLATPVEGYERVPLPVDTAERNRICADLRAELARMAFPGVPEGWTWETSFEVDEELGTISCLFAPIPPQ